MVAIEERDRGHGITTVIKVHPLATINVYRISWQSIQYFWPKRWTDPPTEIDQHQKWTAHSEFYLKAKFWTRGIIAFKASQPHPPQLPSQLPDNFLNFTALLWPLPLSQRCVGNTLQWLTNLCRGFYDQKLKSHSAWVCQGILTPNWWDHWAALPQTWYAAASRAGGPC